MNKLTALMIDDDRRFCEDFAVLAADMFQIAIAHTGKEGLRQLQEAEPDVVLLDLRLGTDMDGIEVLKRIKQEYPDLPVIMITEHADVETAVEAMKLGVLHYTSKSPHIAELKLVIERQLQQINWKLLYRERERQQFDRFIAQSPSMQPILERMDKVSQTDATVLIQGESGTGKELVAWEIHRRSRRREHPFVPVNCSTLSPTFFESEFFGHEKGAFTGAYQRKKGKLEMAHQGTVFLDEIGDLPLESQAKILRAIECQTFERLGGTQSLWVDVRIIAATNKNIEQAVAQKTFREDLYYRLNTVQINLLPLRERREDIPLLAEYFLHTYAQKLRRAVQGFTPSAMKKLQTYPWPGNVRELQKTVEQILVFTTKDRVDASDIDLPGRPDQTSLAMDEMLSLPYEAAKQKLLGEFKSVYFKNALHQHGGNITAAAKALGINRASLHKMLKELKER